MNNKEGLIEAALLVEEMAADLDDAHKSDLCFGVGGPKTKVGWLRKAAREIRARAGESQQGVWYTPQEESKDP